MRTTIDIEDDVLEAAEELAQLQNISAGQVVSKLLRDALVGGSSKNQPESRKVGGFRPFPARGEMVTDSKVNQLRDQEGV